MALSPSQDALLHLIKERANPKGITFWSDVQDNPAGADLADLDALAIEGLISREEVGVLKLTAAGKALLSR